LPTLQSQSTLYAKMRTVEAVIESNGDVRLVEPVRLAGAQPGAWWTILEEPPLAHEAALLSERALAEDWNRAEEDAAWAH